MKYRYFIFISFKGTAYHGWQVQPNSETVQKIIEQALSTILGEDISATGAGRTDTGVHALTFCAHFDSSLSDLADTKKLSGRLNRYLPRDISVKGIKKVVDTANARFSAISRTYMYYISLIKDPFTDESAWQLKRDLNLDLMNEATRILFRYNDFTSFSKLHTDVKTNNCRILHANWERKGEQLVFTIKADRFLRNMVRAIVGTLVDVGSGKRSPEDFENIIISKDRCKAGFSAPAQGLFLTGIEYPDSIFI